MIDSIYIARHGYRLNWLTVNWTSKTGLPRDPPLAAYGETQAHELAQYFQSLPRHEQPTVILSSPYYRCLQTATPTVEALNIPLFVEHGLSEWYSPVKPGTGLHPRPGSAEQLSVHFPHIDTSWQSVWYPSRKGETVEDYHTRTVRSFENILHTLERRHPGVHQRVLLVGHAASVIALTRELVGDRSLAIRAGCCSLTELRRKSARRDVLGAWEAVRLASGDHLAQGASRDWGFEDIVVDELGKVVEDLGIPGSDHEPDNPVGSQVVELHARI